MSQDDIKTPKWMRGLRNEKWTLQPIHHNSQRRRAELIPPLPEDAVLDGTLGTRTAFLRGDLSEVGLVDIFTETKTDAESYLPWQLWSASTPASGWALGIWEL